MATDPSESFQILRPICVKLSKEPTRSVVQELRTTFDHLDPEHLSRLTAYVLFPLKLVIQRHGVSSEMKQDTVSCLDALLQKVKVENFTVVEEVFTQLTVLLSSNSKDLGKIANLSEELKLSIINCLSSLIDSTGLVIKGIIYGTRFLPALGHAISLLLGVAEHEKARNLRVAALRCLKKLAFCDVRHSTEYLETNTLTSNHFNHKNADSAISGNHTSDIDMHEMVSSIKDVAVIAFASFLPGISMTLCRIVSGDPQQGHLVLMAVIDTFADIISMVVNDAYLPNEQLPDSSITATIAALAKLQPPTNGLDHKDKQNLETDSGFVNENSKEKQLRTHQTKGWFTSTTSKLKILIEKLSTSTAGHSNWKVRLSLVVLCDKLLMNCTESLKDSIPGLIDVLVGLSEDEYPQVAYQSKAVLQQFSHQKLSEGSTSLSMVLEENLHSLLTALPRLMRTADDRKKLRTLNLVNGYLGLLGKRITTLLMSASHLRRLSHALLQVLELDVSDVGIVEERTSAVHETAVLFSDTQGENPLSFAADKVAASQFPRHRFKHFTDDQIRVALTYSCQLLGCYGNLSLLVDHFLDLFHESRIQQKQAVFILNEIILGFSGLGIRKNEVMNIGAEAKVPANEKSEVTANVSKDSEELQTAVDLLLSTYISEKNWNLPTSNPLNMDNPLSTTTQDLVLSSNKQGNLKTKVTTFETLNSNIQLVCLLLEGVGTFARVLGQNFEDLLIETLYLILAKLGDDNAAVSRSSYGTLVLICQSIGYCSVEELICRNADYLVNSISLDFKYVFVNHQAPRVLQVMIQYSNSDILSIIEDTLGDVFAVMDLYPEELIYALMKVLHALMCAIKKWFPLESDGARDAQLEHEPVGISTSECDNKSNVNGKDFSREIREFLVAYVKSKQIALGEMAEGIEEETQDLDAEESELDEEDIYKPDDKPEVPLHVKYATQVIEKCIHFLPSRSPVVRLLVLDTVHQAVLGIRDNENELLPMIHRVWPPMARRFTDSEKIVVIKAIPVVCTMADCSGDFMRRRVIKDVLPVLLSYLDKQAVVSLKAGPAYSHSQAFKLQLASLEGLGRLCKQLKISEAELDHVSRTCARYLSSRQPPSLQQAAVKSFENFITLEPDAMWLTLTDMYCPLVPSPPHSMFKIISLGGTAPECKEFAENVTYLLGKL